MSDAQERLRSVIVGCGGIARAHARVLAECDEFDLVAVCDLKEDLAREFAGAFERVEPYSDLREMLERERPDVVSVVTATDSHARLTIAVAQAGVRGICCEKPVATCMAEGREMVAACRKHGAALIINHQRRMGPPLVEMRSLIEQGAIGEVYLIRGSCAGDILSDGTHLIDSIRWLAGDGDVKWVLGQVYREEPDPSEARSPGYTPSGGYRYGHPVETGGMGVFEFTSGMRAEILCGGVQSPGRAYHDCEVFGTKGRLWRQGDRADPPVLIRDARGGGWREAPLPQPDARGRAMANSYCAFARTIREGTAHPLSGDSALKGLEVLMAVYESARTHAKIELPLRQDSFPLGLMIEEGRA